MAVPFRRTSKTAKRKRRTHYKLQTPLLVVCKETGEFTLPHRVTKNSGYYKGRLVLKKPEKRNGEVAEQVKEVQKAQVKKEAKPANKKAEIKKEAPKKSEAKPAAKKTVKKAETKQATSKTVKKD